MPACRIDPESKRIIVKVKLKSDPKKPGGEPVVLEKDLIADSGAQITVIDYENGKKLLLDGKGKSGKMQDSGFGNLLEIKSGVTMEVEVEKHGGGDAETRTCTNMWIHKMTEKQEKETLSGGAKGALGMDQLDSLKADPVKSADGTKAYMAKRV